MKPIQNFLARIAALVACFFLSLGVMAQEGTGTDINVDINKGGDGGAWYAQPWVWIVGAALFILLLVALMRGNRRVD